MEWIAELHELIGLGVPASLIVLSVILDRNARQRDNDTHEHAADLRDDLTADRDYWRRRAQECEQLRRQERDA